MAYLDIDLDAILPLALALALDDFVEMEHPRDKGGKFAKASGGAPNSAMVKVMKAAGFKDAGGGHFEKPGGHTVQVKSGGHYVSSKPGHGPKFGKGVLELAPLLGTTSKFGGKPAKLKPHPDPGVAEIVAGMKPLVEWSGTQVYQLPEGGTLSVSASGHDWKIADQFGGKPVSGKGAQALKTALGKSTAEQPAPSKSTHAHVTSRALAAGFEKTNGATLNGKPVERYAVLKPDGGVKESVLSNPQTGEWRIWHTGTALYAHPGAKQIGSGFAVEGNGAAAFDAVFETLHPRGAGGQFVAKPNNADEGDGPTKGDWALLTKFVEQYGFNPAGMGMFSGSKPGEAIYVTPEGGWSTKGITGAGQVHGKGLGYLSDLIESKGTPTNNNIVAPPPTVPKPPLALGALKKVGGQLGSNPGGQYEDTAGKKYYVKTTPSPEHARNERLAASLYALAGTNTLPYRDTDDPKAVATEMVPLEASNVAALTPAQRKAAQQDFAAHAWLANWDAVGTGGDNVGMVGGKPTVLDTGGSLEYRAKGGSKSSYFTPDAKEWDTLRDKAKNYDAGQLFGDMTPDELKQSAARVAKVSDSNITKAVTAAGYTGSDAPDMIAKLIARRNSVVQQANAAAAAPVKTPTALRKEIAELSPPRSQAVKHAIDDYKGSGYHEMNACMRFFVGCDDPRNTAIEKYLEKTSLPEVTLYRGIRSDYTGLVMPHLKVGRVLPDAGFVSTATDRDFSKGWAGSGGMLLEIQVPAGARGAAVRSAEHSDSEYEILLQRNSNFVIESIDPAKKVIKVRLEQAHMEKKQ